MKARASAIIAKEGAILLIRREREGRVYYVLPGGTVEAGETPEEACIREVREETSLVAESIISAGCHEEMGTVFHTFRIQAFRGTPTLGGPELERNCSSNRYSLEWVGAARLDRIDVFPALNPRCMRWDRKMASGLSGAQQAQDSTASRC